jgi:TolB-like protein/Tfp pilus assembly protein PilF
VPLSGVAIPSIPDYEMIRRIGQGAYGDVWLARGLTGVYRAIKIIWRDRFASAVPFEREFSGLKKFSSMPLPEASQLALLHVGQNEAAGFFYYVMELADDVVAGREVVPATYAPLTLKEVRAHRSRLPAADCLGYAVALARALAGLHERGLVHRDIKPSNIILVGGVPKLADIGLVADSSEALSYVGTEGYVPPEGPGKAAADVYALGRLLYELATGLDREAFPRLPPDLDRAPDRKLFFRLNAVILRACEPRADQRYGDASAMLADFLVLESERPPRIRQRFWLAGAAVLVAAAVVAALAIWPRRAKRDPAAFAVQPATAAFAEAKSLAVLPLENLSPDPNDAYFATGVHQDLLADLTNLGGLKVISRTSVMQYRTTTKAIPQIARELGVAYVLEGSVRREGNQVRVTGQLIKAATDETLWAKTYDRELKDIFSVQSDLAREIAGALDATLSPAEAVGLAARPTKKMEAYDCFQKARALDQSAIDTGDLRDEVVPLLERAVALDPNYVAAWAELSMQQLGLYQSVDHTAARLASAKEALARAQQLAPDSSTVIGAGAEFAAATGDRPTVNRLRRRLVELYPRLAESKMALALSAVHDLRWADAQANYRAALQLDPRNPEVLANYLFFLDSMRRWDEAESVAATLVEVQPDNIDLRLVIASMTFRRSGSTAQLTRLLAELPRESDARRNQIATRSRIAFLTGDWAGIVALWRETGARFRTGGSSKVEARLMVAGAFLKLGDPASARPLLEQSRAELERQLQADPGNIGDWNTLGTTRGMLGDKTGARAALDRAAKLIAAAPEQPARFSDRWDNTVARCWVDEKRAVIRAIAPLLREPSPRPPTANIHVLRVSWASIPLQGDPEFEAMLNDPANNAPLF